MTERNEGGLRGPVRMCGTEIDYVYPDHHWVMHTSDTYTPEGCLLERRHRNPDGSSWSIVCRYDSNGRIVEKETSGHQLDSPARFTYVYDGLGRLERVLMHPEGEPERVYETFRYGNDGTKTQTTYVTPLDDAKRTTSGASSGSALHWSADVVVIMAMFDADGKLFRKVLYDAGDRIIRRIAFRYDSQGLLVEEGEWIAGRIREDFCNLFQYDASGLIATVENRCGDLVRERRAFTYNEHGDALEETIEQSSSLTCESDFPKSWLHRYSYQYDERGNWTQRVTTNVLDSGETRDSMVQRRELLYY